MIKECDIYTLLNAPDIPVVDVRSPAEYNHAHIPGAINLPLFNDEERKTVGIIYKEEGQAKAIETGLDLAGKKLSKFIREAKSIAKNNTVIVHCWRGGMRSKSIATLFDFAGINTMLLNGGYKSYRREIQNFFNFPFPFVILGGRTGSGKTEVLHALQQIGEQVIDMEALAHHKGSAFGAIGEQLQPTTEQFENDLFEELRKCNLQKHIWLEDESHLIGTVFIPEIIWSSMRRVPVVFLDIPIAERIAFLVNQYGKYPAEEIEKALQKITKKLGGQHHKETLELYRNGNLADATEKVLTYYDKTYAHGLSSRNKETIHSLHFDILNPEKIAASCSAFLNTNLHLQSTIYY